MAAAVSVEIAKPQPGERRVVKLNRVRQMVDLSRSQIYELMAEGKFPQSFPYSQKANAWDYSEVQAWLNERMAVKLERTDDLTKARAAKAAKRAARRADQQMEAA